MVIVTTITLDPIKEADFIALLKQDLEWYIESQHSIATTFKHVWAGEVDTSPATSSQDYTALNRMFNERIRK